MEQVAVFFQQFDVYGYSFFLLLGIFSALLFLFLRLSKQHGKFQAYMFIVALFFATIIGGQLFSELRSFYNGGSFSLIRLITFKSGFMFHSTLFFLIITALLISKYFKWNILETFDSLSIAIILASAISRLGCFCRGCCAGKLTDLPVGISIRGDNQKHHPTQIYSFVLELIILLLLLHLAKKKKLSGEIFLHFVWLYGIYRFLIEFIRTNPIFLFGLTHAQIFSIISIPIALSIVIFFRFYKTSKP